MLRAVLNKSCWQSKKKKKKKQQLYGYLPLTKTIQVRRTRHADHCWRNKDKLIKRFTPVDPSTCKDWTPI